jgi:hypothetical protein
MGTSYGPTQGALRGLQRGNRVHFTRYPPKYHPGVQ